jgi:hypothetical protein
MTYQPYFRKFNYIQDYFNTANNLVSKIGPAIPVTYYQVDWENSVYDNDVLVAGNYEKHGVGIKSGIVWKKIYMLPVYQTEQIVPNNNADERGVNYGDSMMSSCVIPGTYGVKSTEWDMIQFDQSFMFQGNAFSPTFIVRNVDISNYGDINYYKLSLDVVPNDRIVSLEEQVNSIYMFLDFDKTIYPITNAKFLLHHINKHDILVTELNKHFHRIGIYHENN